MNINKLIKRLKDDTGLSKMLDLGWTDKEIYDNIIVHSLEEWSHYFKQATWFTDVTLTKKHMIEPDVYIIPEYITDTVRKSGLVIEDIRQVLSTSSQAVAGAGSFVGHFLYDLDTSDQYTALYANYRQGSSEAVNQMNLSCYYEKPNRLRFVFPRPMVYGGFTCNISLYVSQGPNLIGISETREHDFYELCLLNLETVLYENTAKFIDTLQTGMGSLSLKVDHWGSAKERKVELLKELMEWSTIHQASYAHMLTE